MNKALAAVALLIMGILALQLTTALSQSIPLIGANQVWAMQVNGQNLTGEGQVVCVIDSGIDYTHPSFGSCTREQFLAGNCQKIIGGYAFYDNVTSDRNDIMDNWGHGTHVAGIIAANGNTKGIAPDAKLVGVKACSPGYCDDSAVLDAFNWCLENQQEYGITIISMSVGHDIYNRAQCDALNSSYNQAFAEARARDIPVIVAAGNDGSTTGLAFPACVNGAIAVGASTKNDAIAGFSDRNAAMMSLLAPGQDIVSTWIGGITSSMSGTSQATPHVTGSIALLKQLLQGQGQQKTVSEIEEILEGTSKNITDNDGAVYKRIDVFAAIQSLLPVETNNTPTQNQTNQTNITQPQILDFTLSFIAPTENQIIRNSSFTASAQANTTLDSMDVNLDGGAYYHACNNCNSFSVPVDRLQDGRHNLNLLGTLGNITKNLTINFIVNTTVINNTNTTPIQNQTNTTQPPENNQTQNSTNSTNNTIMMLTGFSVNSPRAGESYNDSIVLEISRGNADIVNYSIDGGAFVTYSTVLTLNLNPGSHSLNVRASNNGSYNQSSIVFSIVNTTAINNTNTTPIQNQTNTTQPPAQNQTVTIPVPSDSGGSSSGGGGGGGGGSVTKKKNVTNTNITGIDATVDNIRDMLQNLTYKNAAGVQNSVANSALENATQDTNSTNLENILLSDSIKSKMKHFILAMIGRFRTFFSGLF